MIITPLKGNENRIRKKSENHNSGYSDELYPFEG